jgi:stress response protein YsnF
MYGHTLVAVYASQADAERARDRLMQSGIPADRIRMSEGAQPSVPAAPERRREGFWDWLFGTDIPERDRTWYETNLREGRAALSVLLDSEAERDRVVQMLEQFNPIDVEDTGAAVASQTGMAGPGLGAAAASQQGDVQGREEQVIPVVKEELDVGKRATERRYRIRAYVVQRPIEEAVTLRDERVIIEHRPVGSAHTAGAPEMPQEREYEVVERHEEPVVAKRARTDEEVVVRKEANERTKTVRDTVRETRVDVDKEGAEPEGVTPKGTGKSLNRA